MKFGVRNGQRIFAVTYRAPANKERTALRSSGPSVREQAAQCCLRKEMSLLKMKV